jgi:hypothetical protein
LNETRNGENEPLISTTAGRVAGRIIRTDEELMIARSVCRALGLLLPQAGEARRAWSEAPYLRLARSWQTATVLAPPTNSPFRPPLRIAGDLLKAKRINPRQPQNSAIL